MLGRAGTEVSIVVEAAVLVIMYPLYVTSSARERVCSVWVAACHRGCWIGDFGKEADTNGLTFLTLCALVVDSEYFLSSDHS